MDLKNTVAFILCMADIVHCLTLAMIYRVAQCLLYTYNKLELCLSFFCIATYYHYKKTFYSAANYHGQERNRWGEKSLGTRLLPKRSFPPCPQSTLCQWPRGFYVGKMMIANILHRKLLLLSRLMVDLAHQSERFFF